MAPFLSLFPWSILSNHIDPNVGNALIFVHGYNVTYDGAIAEFGEAYKRAFWQGFRGNFIGFAWDGNPGIPALNYDGAVQNALETSGTFLSFLQYLESPVAGSGPGIAPKNVSVMAHSLGNLVVWDATRIANAEKLGPVLGNLIDVESAVWADAYNPLAPVTFPPDPLSGTIALSIQDLEIDSWLGYFVPAGVPNAAVAGNVVNSYYAGDQALQYYERLNDFLYNQYDKATETPQPPFRNDANLWDTPSLWSVYWPTTFTSDSVGLAVGTVPNPAAKINIDASQYGWGNSDSTDPLHHSDFLKMPYPDIFAWWQVIFGGSVPLGQQKGS
jgi:hypothetical protein